MTLPKLLFSGSALAFNLVCAAQLASAQVVACDLNGVPGAPLVGSGDTLICGDFAIQLGGEDFTLVGMDIALAGDGFTAVGSNVWTATSLVGSSPFEPPDRFAVTAVGSYSFAVGLGNVAVGDQAGVGIVSPFFDGIQVTAVNNGTAIGSHSLVSADNGTAIGMGAQATALNATAVGQNAQATLPGATAIGVEATAGSLGTAIGLNADATGSRATALGAQTDATGVDSTAIGHSAEASGMNSVAIGANSVADQDNTVSVGSAGAERRIVNVAPGTSPTDAVNVSQLGAVSSNVTTLQSTVTTHTTQITALQAADADFNSRITGLEAVALDFADDLDDVDDRASAGTATAVALSGAMFLPGKSFNLTGNVGAYRGAVAGALQFGALVSDSVAINAGVAHGFNKGGKTAIRAGFTFGW